MAIPNDPVNCGRALILLQTAGLITLVNGNFALDAGLNDEENPVWSPDGTKIAFVSNREQDFDRTHNTDVFVADAKPGSTARQLTSFPHPTAGAWRGVRIAPPSLLWKGRATPNSCQIIATATQNRDIQFGLKVRFRPLEPAYFQQLHGTITERQSVTAALDILNVANQGAAQQFISGANQVNSKNLGSLQNVQLPRQAQVTLRWKF